MVNAGQLSQAMEDELYVHRTKLSVYANALLGLALHETEDDDRLTMVLRNIERLERPFHDVRRPIIRAPEAKRGGEKVFETENLTAGYGDHIVWNDVNIRVGRGDRIGARHPDRLHPQSIEETRFADVVPQSLESEGKGRGVGVNP